MIHAHLEKQYSTLQYSTIQKSTAQYSAVHGSSFYSGGLLTLNTVTWTTLRVNMWNQRVILMRSFLYRATVAHEQLEELSLIFHYSWISCVRFSTPSRT